MDQTTRSPKARLRLSGHVKFPDAERLAAQLAAMLVERAVEIDATGLEETDAAILQVIVAARLDADRKRQDLKLVFPENGSVADLAQRLGLKSHLMTKSSFA